MGLKILPLPLIHLEVSEYAKIYLFCHTIQKCYATNKMVYNISVIFHGLVKVSTGILKVKKLSGAVRQTANLNTNANSNEVALAA